MEIAGQLARFVWEELPEIATTSDMNGYREVMAMAPYLNVATFNNGWDGIDHHNQGRHLLNRAFLEELQSKTGAIPWFVNAGSGPLPVRVLLLEDEQVRRARQGRVVLQPAATSRARSCGREGDDDLSDARLRALPRGHRRPEVPLQAGVARSPRRTRRARRSGTPATCSKTIADGIADDWTLYEGKGGRRFPDDGFARLDPEKATSFGRLNALRLEVANAILALQGTAGR